MNNSVKKSIESEKHAFYTWALKWASNNNNSMKEKEKPVDLPQIVAVVQAMGFKLETVDQPSSNEKSEDTINIEIEVKCNKSGLRAILSKQIETCICPNSETANHGQFWVVSGTGPSTSQENLNKIDETRSNLIPQVSKEKSMVMKDVLRKLFATISETDENQNEHPPANAKDSWRVRSLSDLGKPTLARQDTWEVDPKISPPTGTSSPISQQSVNNDKEQLLTELLVAAKESLDKALILLPQKNNTFTKTNLKRVSNIKVSPTIQSPTRATSGKSTPDLPKRQTPIIKLGETPKSSTAQKRNFAVTSKIGSFRKESVTPHLTPTNPKSRLLKTSSSLALNKISPMNLAVSEKKTLGSISKHSSFRISNTNIAVSPGLKTLKPRTGIPSFGLSKPGLNTALKKSK